MVASGLTLDDRFVIPSAVASKLLKDEAVLLDLKEGLYFGLNEVGARMWALISEGKSLAEVCDTLLVEYDVERAELERHALTLAQDLFGRGLIVPMED